jgi:kanamycin nucleotidyltransferase
MIDYPEAIEHTQRLDNAYQIAQSLQAHYGRRLLALGIYGSLARGADGPYSDIEMHCILTGTNFETVFEWSAGPWKAEVDVYTPDIVLREASRLDGDWAMTHGCFTTIMPFHDPEAIFPRLCQAATDHSSTEFDQAIKALIVEEIYELAGKLRNASRSSNVNNLPLYAVQQAVRAAWLAGLVNQNIYSSASHMLAESLAWPNLPVGHHDLLHMVIGGELSHPDHIFRVCEAYWTGVQAWAQAHGLELVDHLEQLLAEQIEE